MGRYLLLLWLCILKIMPCFASSNPIFSIVANTPTLIIVPTNRHTYVQYTVKNNTAITRTVTMIPIPNVTQITSNDSECSNPFTLAPNQSCNLTLYIDGALQNSNYSGGPVICKTKGNSNLPDPFLCAQPERSMELFIYTTAAVSPTSNKLYVSNWSGGSISLCYINDNSGYPQQCLVSAVNNTFLNPEALAISGNYLFVANIGGGMSSCSIDAYSGELTNCGNAITDASALEIHAPDGIAIDGTTAYISNSGPELANQGVTICTIIGGSLGSCVFKKGTAFFAIPSDLAFFNNTVYVTNFESLTTYCPTGSDLCTNPEPGQITGTSTLLNEPEGIFITTIGSNNYAYFTNHGNHTVTLCQITAPNTFMSCDNTEGTFTGFGNLTILNNPLKAYIPSGLKTISVCDVDASNGTLSNCENSPESSFTNPSGLVLNQ